MATNCIRFGYKFGIEGCIFMWKIILADYVGTPTRAGARTPPILRKQRETLLCFRFLDRGCSCIYHGIACLYRRRGDTGEALHKSATFNGLISVYFRIVAIFRNHYDRFLPIRWKCL